MKMYKAVAVLSGGQQIQKEGTFEECRKWGEDVLRENGEDITLTIRQTDIIPDKMNGGAEE